MMYGRNLTPSHPGGTDAASLTICPWSQPYQSSGSSTTLVQFIVHSSGRYPPVASQKGATAPVASMTGVEEYPKTVPLVPKLTTKSPSSTHPAPKALIMLSPLPTETMAPAGINPSSQELDASAVTVPSTPLSSGSTMSGNVRLNLGSTNSHRSSRNDRVVRSKTPIPDASPGSVAISPVSL